MLADKDANQPTISSANQLIAIRTFCWYKSKDCFLRVSADFRSGLNPIVPVLHLLNSFHRSALSLKLDWTTLEFN